MSSKLASCCCCRYHRQMNGVLAQMDWWVNVRMATKHAELRETTIGVNGHKWRAVVLYSSDNSVGSYEWARDGVTMERVVCFQYGDRLVHEHRVHELWRTRHMLLVHSALVLTVRPNEAMPHFVYDPGAKRYTHTIHYLTTTEWFQFRLGVRALQLRWRRRKLDRLLRARFSSNRIRTLTIRYSGWAQIAYRRGHGLVLL